MKNSVRQLKTDYWTPISYSNFIQMYIEAWMTPSIPAFLVAYKIDLLN